MDSLLNIKEMHVGCGSTELSVNDQEAPENDGNAPPHPPHSPTATSMIYNVSFCAATNIQDGDCISNASVGGNC